MTYRLTPDQQHRGQINGAPKSHKPLHATMCRIVLTAIERQPMGSGQISKALNFGEHHVNTVLKLLAADKKIVCIGTAEQAGITGFRKDTKIWAKPGTPELPPVKPVSVTERAKNPAPGWYRHEFNRAGRSEKEFYGHRDTAMEIRK